MHKAKKVIVVHDSITIVGIEDKAQAVVDAINLMTAVQILCSGRSRSGLGLRMHVLHYVYGVSHLEQLRQTKRHNLTY